jgi:hypothetical protein
MEAVVPQRRVAAVEQSLRVDDPGSQAAHGISDPPEILVLEGEVPGGEPA